MLRATIVFFAPVVGGIVITLHQIIQDAMVSAQASMSSLGYQQSLLSSFSFASAPIINNNILQLIVGVYILLLGVILIRFVSLIENGPDEVEVKLDTARTIPIVLIIFTGVMLVSKMTIGGGI